MNRRSIFRTLAGAVAACFGAKAVPAIAAPDTAIDDYIRAAAGATGMPRFRGIADAIRGRVHSWTAPPAPTYEECVIMVARALTRCRPSNTDDAEGYRRGCAVDWPFSINDYTDWIAKSDRGEALPVLGYRPQWVYDVPTARLMLLKFAQEIQDSADAFSKEVGCRSFKSGPLRELKALEAACSYQAFDRKGHE